MQSDEEYLEWVYDMTTESDGTAPDWLPHPDEFKIPTAEDWKNLRDRAGLTLRETAEEVDVTRKTISRWERGRTFPGIDDAQSMLEVYQAEIEADD